MTDHSDDSMTETHQAVAAAVLELISAQNGMYPAKVELDASLEALDLKSMDIAMIMIGIEEKFDLYIPADEALSKVRTVNDIVSEVTRRLDEIKAGSS